MYLRLYILFTVLVVGALCGCDSESSPVESSGTGHAGYLGHSDSARYVGMETCRNCHQHIYETYIRTGMGSSFGRATQTKSSASFSSAHVYDKHTDLHYNVFWLHDSMYINEYRLAGRDTVHQRIEQVNFVIGSGQHTNSHLQSQQGYIHQMPMTYYTQSGKWDLPPGFENGVNTRFSRKIGLECMSCHNAYPDFVKGSENKFRSLPGGIDCERCHGPGSFHVQQRQNSAPVDTSKYIDYSIVNPAKLPIDKQFDICQRCHLQGNAILKPGKSFFDFKPGHTLSDVISVFMPKYKGGEDQFIMASHAERLRLSPCFIKSLDNGNPNALRPYKGALTCVTCHNPHVSVTETNSNVFNEACAGCHAENDKLKTSHRTIEKWNDCVKCHMPSSGSVDIPHVTVHDHFIRKPVTESEKKQIREFLGLYSVNEAKPDPLTRARAYIDQYEKFGQETKYLDSAAALLKIVETSREALRARIQLHFIRNEFGMVKKIVSEAGEKKCLEEIFTETTYDNADAWAAYRVGESLAALSENAAALKWFRKAADLAPFNLDFRNKLGATLTALNDIHKAREQFEFILSENPSFVSAYANLGYLRLMEGMNLEAKRLLLAGKKLDPDNEPLLLNLATCHLQLNEREEAVQVLRHIVKNNPAQLKALKALEQLKKL